MERHLQTLPDVVVPDPSRDGKIGRHRLPMSTHTCATTRLHGSPHMLYHLKTA